MIFLITSYFGKNIAVYETFADQQPQIKVAISHNSDIKLQKQN
jgi:hypothetical protein